MQFSHSPRRTVRTAGGFFHKAQVDAQKHGEQKHTHARTRHSSTAKLAIAGTHTPLWLPVQVFHSIVGRGFSGETPECNLGRCKIPGKITCTLVCKWFCVTAAARARRAPRVRHVMQNTQSTATALHKPTAPTHPHTHTIMIAFYSVKHVYMLRVRHVCIATHCGRPPCVIC